MRRRLLLGASFSALATAAQAQVRLFGPQPPGAAIGRHGRPTYGPSPLGVPPPTLDFNFLTGALDPAITFSRADTTPNASYIAANGVLRYGPTNQTSLSVNTGTWGIVGEGTSTANNVTAPDGTLTGSRLVAGATNAIHTYTLGGATPAPSTPYTLSVHAKQGAGTTKIGVQLRTADWVGGDVKGAFDLSAVTAAVTTNNGTATITDVGSGWFRCSITGTSLASGLSGAALWLPVLRADGSETYLGSGETAYFWGVQYEQGPTATGYIPTTGAAASGPRFDYSPSTVTNWIRNNSMAGANTTGNVFPTFWLHGENTTLTPTIVGVGTETGIPYVDIQISGAATSGNNNIFFDAPAAIQALTGQTWTHSVYLRIVGGSTTNLNQVYVSMQMRDSAGSGLGSFTSNVLASLNGNALAGNRFTLTSALNNASTAFVQPWIQINPQSAAINITLRIGAPQLEQAAAANAFVPTSGTFAGSGGAMRGLLIEESRTNLSFPSADPVTLFTTSGATLTAASGTAPDGTVTMTKMTESATNAAHYTSKLSLVTASATMTFSLFAQAQQVQFLQLYYDDGSANGMQATFDLINGTASTAATRGTGTATGVSITPFGRGIYRLSITGVAAAATNIRYGAILSQTISNGFASPYLGNGTNGLLIWGIQFEAGTAATSYIPTVAGAVSRLADVATMPVTVPAAYAVAAEVMVPIVINNSIVQGLAVLDDGTANNRVPLRIITAAIGSASVVAGVGTTQPIAAGTVTANTALKGAYSAGAGALTAAFAGGVSAPGSGALPAGLTTLRMGTNASGGGYLDGWLRRVRYWPQALTNQQLVQVTT